jgi:uncharacterized protein YqfA (UPF0365 family)
LFIIFIILIYYYCFSCDSVGVRSSRVGKSSRGSVAQSRAKGAGDRDRIVVLDDNGRDVTPKPMLSLKPTVLKGSQMSGVSATDSGSPQSEVTPL